MPSVMPRRPYLQPFLSGQAAIDSLPPAHQSLATMKVAAKGIKHLDVNRSDLVRGFLAKCAEARLSQVESADAVARAVLLHPAIRAEFQKCGYVSVGPQAPQPPKLTQPAAQPPKLTQPPAPNLTQPVQQPNMLGRGLDRLGNVAVGTATAAAGGVGTTLAGLGSLGARAIDATGIPQRLGATDGLTPRADAATGTMMDAVHAGMANATAGLAGVSPESRAQFYRDNGYSNAKTVGQMTRDHVKLLGETAGPHVAGIYNTLMSTGQEAANMIPSALLNRFVPAMNKNPLLNIVSPFGLQAAGSTPVAMAHGAVAAAPVSHSLGEFAQNTLENTPKYNSGVAYATGQGQEPVVDPSLQPPATPTESGAAPGRSGWLGQQAQQSPTGEQPPGTEGSPITQTPMYQQIVDFVQQAPQQAYEYGKQAMGQLSKAFQSDAGKAEVSSVMEKGTLTPGGQQQALTALSAEGVYDPKQAWQTIQNMSGWEQLGLWGGVGMAALGLLNVLGGEGGIGSLLMSLVGLGTAAFTAGNAGLLDQGAKDLAGGLSEAATGGQQQGLAIPDSVKSMLPTIFDNVPDAAASPALKQLAANYPEIGKQLDRAAGTGSWGNSALSWLGNITGQRQQMMQDQLGLNPQQQDRLLQLWQQARQQQ